jgi:uncharacterized protein YggT (Ycf19 family)
MGEDPRVVREEPRLDSQPVNEPPPAGANANVVASFSPARRAFESIYIVFAAIDVTLLFRILLKGLGANAQVPFTSFVYGVSGFFLAPFRGMLPTVASGKLVLEVSALFALVVYALVGYLLARLVASMFRGNVTVSRRDSARRDLKPHSD